MSLGTEIPIVQFPYQNISSWGSSPSSFQFTVFDHPKKELREEYSVQDDATEQVNSRYNRDSSSDSREATSEYREISSGTSDRTMERTFEPIHSNRDLDEDESVSISETIKCLITLL